MARLFKGVIGANSMMAALLLVVPVLSLYIKISPMTFINALGNGQVFSPLFLSLITSGIATLIAFILGLRWRIRWFSRIFPLRNRLTPWLLCPWYSRLRWPVTFC